MRMVVRNYLKQCSPDSYDFIIAAARFSEADSGEGFPKSVSMQVKPFSASIAERSVILPMSLGVIYIYIV